MLARFVAALVLDSVGESKEIEGEEETRLTDLLLFLPWGWRIQDELNAGDRSLNVSRVGV